MHHGSKLNITPTIRDVIQQHEELTGWLKSKEKKPEPVSFLRFMGWLFLILWGAPMITLLEYLLLRQMFPMFFK